MVGNKRTAIPIAYVALSVNKPVLFSSNQVDFTNPRAVELQTLTKITIRKKLFIKIAKQMTYMARLPMIRKPISNMELGVSGQTSLALRYKTLLKMT